MGRKAERSGVTSAGKDRIQFDFELGGKRYRPSIKRAPTEGNLDRAYRQLRGIRARIARGTFDGVWRPVIGEKRFESIRYTDLLRVADDHPWSKQTYNNIISVIRCAFDGEGPIP